MCVCVCVCVRERERERERERCAWVNCMRASTFSSVDKHDERNVQRLQVRNEFAHIRVQILVLPAQDPKVLVSTRSCTCTRTNKNPSFSIQCCGSRVMMTVGTKRLSLGELGTRPHHTRTQTRTRMSSQTHTFTTRFPPELVELEVSHTHTHTHTHTESTLHTHTHTHTLHTHNLKGSSRTC